MKIPFKMLAAVAMATAATGCSSFLDVNDNPNSPTTITPDNILAQALTTTASLYTGGNPSFNHYGSFVAGYWGRSGVVNGYQEETTINYTNTFQQALFNNTYDNLNDYNIIQTKGMADGYPNHAAIARIMKTYQFLLLVDEYGDIPYTQALQGAAVTTPVYDKAADIYKDLLVQLSGAISDINAVDPNALTVGNEDVVFKGDMKKWKQFANSLKLRILLRQSQTEAGGTASADVKSQLAALQSAPDGFIAQDVVVQPVYAQAAGQQNPFYNRYGLTAAGTNATELLYQIPTKYIIAVYENNKDPRVAQLYKLGLRNDSIKYIGTKFGERSPPGFSATQIASRFLPSGGLLKGPSAPTVLMLLSEHLLSKAEAETRGLFTADAVTAEKDYKDGIKASFLYFYRPAGGAIITLADATDATPGVKEYNQYIAANLTNPKVDYKLAPTKPGLGKQEVIIFQKYLALNSVGSIEAWDDYRRTGLPKFDASTQSQSPRADKLPTRLLYPLSESSTNQANVPVGVDQYTKIFWDVVD
ncbi:SusD/RagB family nutrient-binding outer membrane lipoprotein [Hymenobacter actinosclerus]|uniref:Starch-binding associating with outer membrane n=1 Tax=Hymenobacter actinosclerus TaxID=82805 RepID=A0A1I0APE8_9BACT|nr:SusD/RagB family nutrient-binding outer membrane lipoprotein [Hymenobacter actinosclerus]SES96202.1 Starch-binding associating with outer membrane [Hymenobacter actinosclerus]